MEMTIARAMKHRARVAARLTRVSYDIQTQNSHLADNKPEVDVKALMEVRDALMGHLVDLRVAIDAASSKIKRHLFDLAEKKALMTFLQHVDTKDGKQASPSWRGSIRSGGVDTGLVIYKAIYRKPEIDEMVVKIETDIDALQERLDQHNATTTITVEVPGAFNHPHRK